MKRLVLVTLAMFAVCFMPHQAFSQKILTTIKIGGITGTPAINTVTNMIYVPNATTGALAVINGETNQIVTNIPVGPSPAYAAVNMNTNTVYVSGGQATEYIAVIDGSSNTITTTVSVTFGGPMAVNSAANLVYFLNGFGTLSVLDGASNQVIRTVTVAKSCCVQSIAYGPFANRIYVTVSTNDLLIIDAASLEFITAHFPNAIQLIGIAADNSSNRTYLNSGGDGLYVVNGTTGKLISTILPGYFGPIAMNSSDHLVADFDYSSVTGSVFLAFVNGRTYGVVGTDVVFPVSTDPYTLTAGSHGRFYVTFYQRDGIAVVSAP